MSEKRICGGCTECCKTHGIRELSKKPGEWCAHCAIGQGCNIYSSRPKSCRIFDCAWIIGFGEDHQRPDRSNLVVEFRDTKEFGGVMFLFECVDGACSTSLAKKWTRAGLMSDVCVNHIRANDRGHTIFLPQRLANHNKPIRFGEDERQTEVQIVHFIESQSLLT